MVANAEGTTPGAGWFADPAGSPYLRWWDGSQWTDNFIDAKTGAPPGELPAAPSAQSTAPEAVEAQPEAGIAEQTSVAAQSGVADQSGVASQPMVADPVEPVADPSVSGPSSFAPAVPAAGAAATDVPLAAAGAAPGAAAGPQLTRRQARIMQEMEEARNNGTVAGSASSPVAPGETATGETAPAAGLGADDAVSFGAQPVVPRSVAPEAGAPAADTTAPGVPGASVPGPEAQQPFMPQQPVVQQPAFQPVVPQPVVPQPLAPQPTIPAAAEIPVQTPIVPPPTPAPAVQPPVVQEPVIVAPPTPPTPFDSSTVAPPAVTTAPTQWPFAATPDVTTAIPAAAAVESSSATPWLNAPAPSPDAMLPVEKSAYEPMARPRSQSDTAQEVFVGTTNNWAIWVFAALPILHLAIIWYIYTTLQPAFDSPIRWGVLLGPIVFYVLLAAVDLSILKRNGHVNLPSVLLAIIPLLYLGIRSARLGVRTLPPLVVWVVLQAAAVVALMFVFPTIYSQLTSASDPTPTTVVGPVAASQSLTSAQRATELTPSGMADAITKQLGAKGVTLKSVTCPPLASTQDAVTVTCVGSVDDGSSLNIVVAVDSKNKTSAFDIVSSGPAS